MAADSLAARTKFPPFSVAILAQAVLVQSGERRAVAVVAPRFESVSRLWVLTGLKHQPPVFSRLPVQQGKGGSSQTASGLCLVRHSTCVRLALLVETNPCFSCAEFSWILGLAKTPVFFLQKYSQTSFLAEWIQTVLQSRGASFLGVS